MVESAADLVDALRVIKNLSQFHQDHFKRFRGFIFIDLPSLSVENIVNIVNPFVKIHPEHRRTNQMSD